MIYANPQTGSASEDAAAPVGYTLSFGTPAEYEAWRAAAFPVQPAEPPAPQVPAQVTNAQFRAALLDFNIEPEAIDTVINNIPDTLARKKAFQWWNFSNFIERNSSYVAAFAPVFGLSSEQVDALFISANTQGT